MKTPHLFASLAVAVTATAADLKDSTQVAREWNEAVTRSPPLAHDPGLRGTAPLPRGFAPEPGPVLRDKSHDIFRVPPWGVQSPRPPAQSEPLIDSPSYRVPEELPDNTPMPRGARPWLYGGQTYWLMPLIPSRAK